jgi:carboxylesterase
VADILDGLGDYRIMAGLSLGGTLSSWAAQNRSDLDLAMPISPAFGFKVLPGSIRTLAVNAVVRSPDLYLPWDPRDLFGTPRLRGPNDKQGYPFLSLHALAQTLRLGLATRALAARTAPAARAILVVTNASDPAVDNDATAAAVADWRAHSANLTAYEFPQTLGLPHDLIDPHEPGGQVDAVYARLIELINTGER